MKAYNIATAANVQQLIEQVNLRADEGWEPFGNPFMDNAGSMCQAMIKEVQDGLTATDTYNAWTEENLGDDITIDEQTSKEGKAELDLRNERDKSSGDKDIEDDTFGFIKTGLDG